MLFLGNKYIKGKNNSNTLFLCVTFGKQNIFMFKGKKII